MPYFVSNVFMKKISPFLFLVFAVFSYSCRKPQAFQYRDLRNFHLENFGFSKSRVSMDFIFFNPNNYGVDLKKVDCDVYLDSSYVGKFLLDTIMHIPQASEFAVPANLDIDMKSLLKNSLTVLISNEVLIGAKGTTRVGRKGIYVTIPFHYEGKQKLNLLN
jgi:LEA14-like dessication related protein